MTQPPELPPDPDPPVSLPIRPDGKPGPEELAARESYARLRAAVQDEKQAPIVDPNPHDKADPTHVRMRWLWGVVAVCIIAGIVLLYLLINMKGPPA